MGYYENSHSLRDGAILVYTRSGRKKTTWQTRLKVPGVTGYIIWSLKTSELNSALTEAEDLFHSLRAEQKVGLDVKQAGNLRFKDLWKRFYTAHERGLSVHRQRLHKFMATKYFIPYFGEYRVADMPDALVERYWDWRINFHKDADKELEEGEKRKFRPNVAVIPAQKTLDMEAGMLRQIFRWGKRIGAVKREPWVKATKVKHTKGVERRPTFTEAEWKTVYMAAPNLYEPPELSGPPQLGDSLNLGESLSSLPGGPPADTGWYNGVANMPSTGNLSSPK